MKKSTPGRDSYWWRDARRYYLQVEHFRDSNWLLRVAESSGMRFRKTALLALGSLAIYIYDAVRPRQAQAAFFYVVVPPASVLLEAIVVPAAALLSRRDSRKSYRS